MSNLKRTSMVFLILAVLAVIVSHTAVWYQLDDESVVVSSHKLWGTEVGFANNTETAYWLDEDLDKTEGIEQLRLAGPLVALGSLTALIALIVVATRMDHHHRIVGGGILALIATGALLGGALVYMQGIGAEEFDSENYSWSGGLFATFFASGAMFLGGVLSFGYIRNPIQQELDLPFEPEPEPEDEPYEHEVRKLTENEERLRCPACKHMFIHPKGVPHECPECGYEAE